MRKYFERPFFLGIVALLGMLKAKLNTLNLPKVYFSLEFDDKLSSMVVSLSSVETMTYDMYVIMGA